MSRKHKTIPGLSQKKLSIAKELGFSKSTLYEWRKTRPKLYEIIMKHYGINENAQTQDEQNK